MKTKRETMKSIKWVAFHFESNQAFGDIESLEQWLEMKARWEVAYPGHDIYDCKECTYPRAMPDFGQRREHQGDRTLREFFTANEMPMEDRGGGNR
jgi:hypothetical protein